MKSMRNNTYTQIHIQMVFAVQNRGSLILDSWRARLYKYMIAIIQNNRHKVLAIGGTADHVHILIGMRPSQSLSELMQYVKGCSSKWINENRLASGWFSWQEGYGAFSYSKEEIPTVIRYIENQAEHHKQQDMVDEYKQMLKESEVEYDEKKSSSRSNDLLKNVLLPVKNIIWASTTKNITKNGDSTLNSRSRCRKKSNGMSISSFMPCLP